MNTTSRNRTIVIDKNGIVVADSSHQSIFLQDVSNEKYAYDIFTKESPSGYFVQYVDGIKSLIIYVNYEALNWTFIRTIPYDSIMHKIDTMRNTIFLICGLILVLGFFLSFFVSRVLYKPYNSIVSQIEQLESEKRNSFYTLKQEFLRSILYGKGNLLIVDFTYRDDKRINIDFDADLFLLLITIDDYFNFCNLYNFDDRNTIKFGILNIASELCSPIFRNETVDMGEKKMVLIINLDKSEYHTELEEIIKKIQYNVKFHFQISLSFTATTICNRFEDIPMLYNEVVENSYYKMYFGYGCIIFPDMLKDFKDTNEYILPSEKETGLIKALMSGDLPDVKLKYRDILDDVTNYSYTVFHSTLIHLSLSIYTAIKTMKNNGYIQLSTNFSKYIEQLNTIEIIEEMNAHFFNLFELVCNSLSNSKVSKHMDMMISVINLINENYADYNLSIDLIANKLSISPGYLGQLFKSTYNKSITDYIKEVRLQKAVELLLSTNLSIDTICSKSGFLNSPYFYRVFKKHFGTTPNDYKTKHR